jgi:hypothetical protein
MMVYIRSTDEWVCTRHGRFPGNMFRKDESRKRSNPYTSRVDFYCFLDSLVDEMEKYNWIDAMFAIAAAQAGH